jgi:hypothetical protein
MNQDERTVAIAEKDRCWADLRENEKTIASLLKGKKDLDPIDFLLFYQCVVIVLAEFMIYEEPPSEMDIDEGMSGSLLRTIREVGYWKDMSDEKLSSEKRTEALKKIRKSIWDNMFVKKDRIIKVQATYPDIDKEDMHLMMQCVAIVSLELDLKKREIELMY